MEGLIFIIVIGIGIAIGIKRKQIKKERDTKFICPNPNCGYQGYSHRESRANLFVGFLLLCFFIVPGILYFMIKNGYNYRCPKCGVQVRTDW